MDMNKEKLVELAFAARENAPTAVIISLPDRVLLSARTASEDIPPMSEHKAVLEEDISTLISLPVSEIRSQQM